MNTMVATGCMVVFVLAMVTGIEGLECGIQRVRFGKIVGGEDAFDGEFPFMVSIRLGGTVFGQHHCGGVIIKKHWILTAAHCVTSYSKNAFTVRTGEFDLYKNELNHTENDYPLEKIVLHPDMYNPKRYNNDIALLKLQKPVEYDSYSWPTCLPDLDEDFTGQMGTVIGWGHTEESGGRRSQILQKVDVQIMNRTQCQELIIEAKKKLKLEHGQICAGFREGQKDSCQGDSGGPLIKKKDGRYTVIGVVSAGIGCARPLLPGIYTYVPNFINWIKETVENEISHD